MAYRNIVRGCFVAAISAAILLFARDGTDSFAANAAQTILRPITPAQPAPNTNAGPQMSTTPNIPPASSIPGTDAYEIVQLRMRVDALSEAVNALRLQLGQTTRETNATLLTLRRPVCIADQVLRDPVSTATENCSPEVFL